MNRIVFSVEVVFARHWACNSCQGSYIEDWKCWGGNHVDWWWTLQMRSRLWADSSPFAWGERCRSDLRSSASYIVFVVDGPPRIPGSFDAICEGIAPLEGYFSKERTRHRQWGRRCQLRCSPSRRITTWGRSRMRVIRNHCQLRTVFNRSLFGQPIKPPLLRRQ